MGVWRTDFRLAASKVPFSEVADFRVLSYGSLGTRLLKEERNWGKTARRRCYSKPGETSRGASDGAAARPVEGGKPEAAQLLGVTHKGLTAALDSGVLTPRLSDAIEKVPLALDDLRALVDKREDRRKWDLKGVQQGVPHKAFTRRRSPVMSLPCTENWAIL